MRHWAAPLTRLPWTAPGADLRLREAAHRAERAVIVEALRAAAGNRSEAARLLGVDPRNLAYYLRKHGVREG